MNLYKILSDIFTLSAQLEYWYNETTIENNSAFDACVLAMHSQGLSQAEIVPRLKKIIQS